MKNIYIIAITAGIIVLGAGAFAAMNTNLLGFGSSASDAEVGESEAIFDGIPVVLASEAGLDGAGGDGGLGTGIYPWDVILGDVNAPVTIFEYASKTCPHCADFHRFNFKPIVKDLIASGQARFVYRDFPLDQIAFQVSMLGRCLPAESFMPFTEKVYANQAKWARAGGDVLSTPRKYAEEFGLTEAQIETCLADETLRQNIFRVANEARSVGVRSTPTIFVNNRRANAGRSPADLRALFPG